MSGNVWDEELKKYNMTTFCDNIWRRRGTTFVKVSRIQNFSQSFTISVINKSISDKQRNMILMKGMRRQLCL